jgi:hypothetical protein
MTSFPKAPSSSPVERPAVVRDETGVWAYGDTGIPAVGAREITLAQRTKPRRISRADAEPEAILLSISEIERDGRLNFALQEGARVEIRDEELHYRVPWNIWQEYAAEPVDVWLPENESAGLDQKLALAEREHRFAKQALEEAGLFRHYLVILAARLGRSRRVVSETLGLSPARIQQLNEVPPPEVVAGVTEFLATAVRIAALIGDEAVPRDEFRPPPDLGSDEFDEALDSMIDVGLLDDSQQGMCLTEDGKALLEGEGASVKRSDKSRSRPREVSDVRG